MQDSRTNPENTKSYNPDFGHDRREDIRRENDQNSLVVYRIDRLEKIVEKLVENHDILIRIELSNLENGRAITAISDRVSYQGKVMDLFAKDIESTKGSLGTIDERSSSNTKVIKTLCEDNTVNKSTVKTHSWLIGAVTAAFIVMLVNKFGALL